MKSGLILYLYSGTNNNFVLFDLRSLDQQRAFTKSFKNVNRAKLAKSLCRKFKKRGGDGLVILQNTKGADLAWDFYNADGSRAEMCGNASRCVGLHVSNGNQTIRPIRLKTGSGIVGISVQNANKIFVKMPAAKGARFNQKLSLGKAIQNYDFVNSGVPHTLIELKKWRLGLKEDQLSKKIKSHKKFHPQSTNVTFWHKLSSKHIRAATFERGVKGFTQACGTGAVAAALAFSSHQFSRPKLVQVRMPGGQLTILIRKPRPILIGAAKRIAKIVL